MDGDIKTSVTLFDQVNNSEEINDIYMERSTSVLLSNSLMR